MENINYLLDILQKDKLSEHDKNELQVILQQDNELKEFYSAYSRLKSALLQSKHLSIDDIADYILVKNSLEPVNRLSGAAIPNVEKHLRECNVCIEEFKFLNSEFSEVENFIASEMPKEAPVQTKQETVVPHTTLSSRFVWISAAVILLIFGSLWIGSGMLTPGEYKWAAVDDPSFYVTRGRGTEDFHKSMLALEENNYKEAENYLLSDINKNPNDETIFYSHYILGLMNLESAKKDFIGLFPRYDENLVNKGINHLNKAVEKNSSGKFSNLTLDAYYYLGKAYLMNKSPEKAKEYFNLVINEKGSKIQDAKLILSELE